MVTPAKRYLKSRTRLLLNRLRKYETAVGIIVAVIVGLLAGLGVVAFRKLIRLFQWIFFKEGANALDFLGDYYVILLPVMGALLLGTIIYFLSREARGEGPPGVMEAIELRGGRIHSRVAAVKALASSICIGSGGSVGPEGPVVHIGGSIGSIIGQLLRLPEAWIKTLVLCGAAGGISATFNAPIGGVMFALEVLSRRYIPGNLFYIVISSVTADVIAHHFLGDQPAFVISPDLLNIELHSAWEVIPYIVLGIICGLASMAFVRFFYKSEDIFKRVGIPGYLKPVLGGIIVGIIGMYYFDIFGVGYGEGYGLGGISIENGGIDKALLGELTIGTMLALFALKMVATSASLTSGGSGGIFAPSLFIGSMLGGAFGLAVHKLIPGITSESEAITSASYALVGMGAFFAGVVRGPITAILLLFEVTRNYGLILPLMTAIVFSTVISRSLNRGSIYTLGLTRRGIDFHRQVEAGILGTITVSKAMTRNYPSIPPSMPIPTLLEEFHKSGHHGFPVVDENGIFSGVVTLTDIEDSMSENEPSLTAGDIATKNPVVAYPDQSVHDALAQLGGRNVGRIPVVDRNNPSKLLGILRRPDIVKAYTMAVEKQKADL